MLAQKIARCSKYLAHVNKRLLPIRYIWRQAKTQNRCHSNNSGKGQYEVEVKFGFLPKDEERIAAVASFVKEERLVDRYFDSQSYALSCLDIWLRARNNRWQCKVPAAFFYGKKLEVGQVDNYKELEEEKDIRDFLVKYDFAKTLGESTTVPLDTFLLASNINEVATIKSTRRKYKALKDALNIDLDLTDFGYGIGELEILVDRDDQLEDAQKNFCIC